MIARFWHGVTPADKADSYYDYLQKTGIPHYQATAGNAGVYVMRRIEGDKAHFLLMTLWESLAAVERFAGTPLDKAHYYPEDADYLLEMEETVIHYDVLPAVSK